MGKLIFRLVIWFFIMEVAIYSAGFALYKLYLPSTTVSHSGFRISFSAFYIIGANFIAQFAVILYILISLLIIFRHVQIDKEKSNNAFPASLLFAEIAYWIFGMIIPGLIIVSELAFLPISALALMVMAASSFFFWYRIRPPLVRSVVFIIISIGLIVIGKTYAFNPLFLLNYFRQFFTRFFTVL